MYFSTENLKRQTIGIYRFIPVRDKLNKEINRGEKMVKISTEISSDIQEKADYKIIQCSDFVSPDKQKGIKVLFESLNKKDKTPYSTILWTRDNVGITSKLGAFVNALTPRDEDGNFKEMNTDDWIGRHIRVISWKSKQREIQALN